MCSMCFESYDFVYLIFTEQIQLKKIFAEIKFSHYFSIIIILVVDSKLNAMQFS